MTSIEQTICDVVADDLNTNAGLPAHNTIRYRRPRAVRPEDCPLLVVWLDNDQPIAIETQGFDTNYELGVSWQLPAVEEASTLVADPVLSAALLDGLDLIKKRVRRLAIDGVTAQQSWQFVPGETRYFQTPLEQGLTEGYAHAVIVRVTHED